MATTQAKNITVNLTIVISVVLALGTTIINLYKQGNEQRFTELESKITSLEEELEDNNRILHTRISENGSEINSLQINLAGYNANLQTLRSDVSEIKTDIKELIRMKPNNTDSSRMDAILEYIRTNMNEEGE
jgi:uncharacterized protein HemX